MEQKWWNRIIIAGLIVLVAMNILNAVFGSGWLIDL